MATYYTIHHMSNPRSIEKILVAICYNEQQAHACFERIVRSDVGMPYVVMERVETNTLGLIVGRTIIAEEFANRSRD